MSCVGGYVTAAYSKLRRARRRPLRQSSSSPSATSASSSALDKSGLASIPTSKDSAITSTSTTSAKLSFLASRHHRRHQSAPPTPTMNLTDLPYTIFLEIISYVSAADALVCRRISRDARSALTRSELSRSLIQLHFPRSREGRLLRRYLEDGTAPSREAVTSTDWAAVFAKLTRRYFQLGIATPRITQKVSVLKDAARLRGVTPWHRFLKLDDKTAPFHYWDPVWTFSANDGILVYPAPATDARLIPEYRARNVGTGEEVSVPFDIAGKIVRRTRLSHGVLVFEWCEDEGSHRHFATAFDVTVPGDGAITPRQSGITGPSPFFSSSSPISKTCQAVPGVVITFRSEWKIHFRGLPLSHQDRFFSTHNRTHYVIYIWQPTRSPWGEDEPLEHLIVWELGEPSPYRPSLAADGKNVPKRTSGPRVIRRMANNELRSWGVLQSDTPRLRDLVLDECTWDKHTQSTCGHVFIHEEEHRWSAGPHSTPNPPRLHHVRSTGIPLLGDGPRWLDNCGGGSGDDGNANLGMSFCWRGPRARRLRNPENAPSFQTRAWQDWDVDDTWPGRAPCWRHDDFPYLTVSEVLDAPAGVRISARQCFMLETLSVNVRPKLGVQGVEAVISRGVSDAYSDVSKGGRSQKYDNNRAGDGLRVGGTKAEGPNGEEVQFADDVWAQLLGKGVICGDERWLVGEDGNGDVTVLIF